MNMGVLSISLFTSAGSMSSAFIINLIETALEKGHKTNIWLAGNATTLAAKNQKQYKKYTNYEKDISRLIEKGADIAVCEMCARTRGIKEDNLIKGIEFALMDWFLERAARSDRTLNVGVE